MPEPQTLKISSVDGSISDAVKPISSPEPAGRHIVESSSSLQLGEKACSREVSERSP
jgi:hypothetical protein